MYQNRIIMKATSDPIRLSYASKLPETVSNLLERKDLCLSIRHDRVIIFKGKDSKYHGKKRDPLSDENLKKRKYQGTLSKSAIKHISKQITLWGDAIQAYNQKMRKEKKPGNRRMTMITVTLSASQRHTDNEIKRRMLVPFIDSLRYNCEVKHYFWRAERQQNGNIHFHIITDTYIDKDQIRNLWNTQQNKLGYIDRFHKKHGHRNPPSTDVFAINNQQKGIKYALKYITKNADEGKISGKIWGMSDSIRNIKNFTLIDVHDYMLQVRHILSLPGIQIYEDEHFISIKLPKQPTSLATNNWIIEQYKVHLLRIYFLLYEQDQKFCTDQGDTIYTCLTYEELLSLSRYV